MRIRTFILALLWLTMCSCSEQGQRLGIGEDPSLIPLPEAREICRAFLAKQGYTNAAVIEETAMSGKCCYRFSTSGTTAPLRVMVDRKTRKVCYGDWKP